MSFPAFVSEGFYNIMEDVLGFFKQYFIQHCFTCCPSESTVVEDAGIGM
jgi:hypothetical protein